MTHYNVLDCSPESSNEEIKHAYHRKVLQFHPDKNDDSSCNSAEFIKVQEAWKVLGDPEARKNYDLQCQQTNFEDDYALVFARVSLPELHPTAEEGVLSYDCRCGSKYLVYKQDIHEKNTITHIPCEECTYVIEIET